MMETPGVGDTASPHGRGRGGRGRGRGRAFHNGQGGTTSTCSLVGKRVSSGPA